MRPQPYENEDELDWKGTLLDRNTTSARRGPSSYQQEPKSRLFTIGIAVGVLAILVTLWVMIAGGGTGGDIPTIKADTTPYKSKPDQPGGESIPFQDKLVFNRLDPNGQPVQAEKLLPAAEEPTEKPAPVTPPTSIGSVTTPTPALPPSVVTAPPTATANTAPTPAPMVVPAAEPVPEAAPATPVAKEPTPAPVAAAPVETPKPTPAPVVETKPAAKAATSAPTPTGSVRVQLASIPNQQNAQKALADFKSKYASALGGTNLSIVQADLGAKGTYYRIQSAPVDKAKADSICSSVKAQGGACITAK